MSKPLGKSLRGRFGLGGGGLTDRAVTIWLNLRSSLWAVPVTMMVVAAVLAYGVLTLEGIITTKVAEELRVLITFRIDSARAIMGVLTGSAITMAALVLSLTTVVFSIAASQFGSRLIHSLMGDRATQIVIGIFMMTIVYCLLVLGWVSAIKSDGSSTLAVLVGMALVMVSVLAVVSYIHHVARSIVADTVIDGVACSLDQEIQRILPARDADAETEVPDDVLPFDFAARARPVRFTQDGYVQTIGRDPLIELAQRADVMIRLDFTPGRYVLPGARMIAVYPGDGLPQNFERDILNQVVLGPTRTATQDLSYSVRHLVELGVRALSPGINDPFSAMGVIDRLGAGLMRIMARPEPPSVWRDDGGTVRLVTPQVTHAMLIEVAFHQMRQASQNTPAVMIHMLKTLRDMGLSTQTSDHQAALLRQAELMAEAARDTVIVKGDCDVIDALLEEARQVLA